MLGLIRLLCRPQVVSSRVCLPEIYFAVLVRTPFIVYCGSLGWCVSLPSDGMFGFGRVTLQTLKRGGVSRGVTKLLWGRMIGRPCGVHEAPQTPLFSSAPSVYLNRQLSSPVSHPVSER